MIDEEILKKAIEKAVGNGWLRNTVLHGKNFNTIQANWYFTSAFIFSHDFAKSFWGENKISDEGSPFNMYDHSLLGADYDWQVHIQKMVLESNPISYLAKFL